MLRRSNKSAARTAPCRPLSASAAPRCAALHAQSFATPWAAAEFERLLTSASVVADGIGEQSNLQGFVLSRRAADEAEILTIAVEPRSRGSGLATALLGAHLSRLSRLGVSELFLEVDEANAPALALYHRYGFQQVGRRPAYYAKADGSRANALILKLQF